MFKKLFLFCFCIIAGTTAFSHNIDLTGSNLSPHHWTLANQTHLQGSFLFFKNNRVHIEMSNGGIADYPLSAFSDADQAYVLHRYEAITKLNAQRTDLKKSNQESDSVPSTNKLIVVISLFTIAVLGVKAFGSKQSLRYTMYFLATGIVAMLYSFRMKPLMLTNSTTLPASIDSAFTPFKPYVNTYWDANYFYVENLGIPQHPMMQGITSWQQQVPLPQCYIGNNHWSIPLNPVISSNPIPVDSIHFTRGAVAIAVNGIAIFNPHTNTGVDAFLDGQLDNWGGHCGRADDYHYHIAPMHLYSTTAPTMPIAYALDGFAVYGSLEPDGTAMLPLDINHGHYGSNGVYHYHGTATAPYMIGNMVGVVTEDTTHQIVPQAAAHPIRPSLNPLPGAVIDSCIPTANSGFNLYYTRNGLHYVVSYSWTNNGAYAFSFINPSGTTTSNYNGPALCQLTTGIYELPLNSKDVLLYPNPAHAEVTLQLQNKLQVVDVRAVSLYSSNGQQVYTIANWKDKIKLSNLPKGLYSVVVETTHSTVVKKLIIE